MKLQVVKEVLKEDCDLRNFFFYDQVFNLVCFPGKQIITRKKNGMKKIWKPRFCTNPSNQLNYSYLKLVSELFQCDLRRDFFFFFCQVLNTVCFPRKQIITRRKTRWKILEILILYKSIVPYQKPKQHKNTIIILVLNSFFLSYTAPLFLRNEIESDRENRFIF